jgi:hypothetical protein
MERRSKYNAKPVEIDGIRFDSTAEAMRYRELLLMEQAGEIWNLKCHVRYEILAAFDHDGKHERPIFYEADFIYFDRLTKRTTIEDVKGVKTAVYKIKRKLFLARYPTLKFVEVEA